MNAVSDASVSRDFSDLAILRGSVAAMAAAYVMLVLMTVVLAVAWSPIGFDLERLLNTIWNMFAQALQPANLVMSTVLLSFVAVIGLFVLAAYKDHTTYRAAFRAGAITGAVAAAIPLLFVLIPTLVRGDFGFLPQLMIFVVSAVATGGLAGLAGRFAAGTPGVRSHVP